MARRARGEDTLSSFIEEWERTHSDVDCDVALFIAPPFTADTDAVGEARGFVDCLPGDSHPAYSWSDVNADMRENVGTVAHELGHNLALNHVDGGIMNPFTDSSRSGFSKISAQSLRAFLRTLQASCITAENASSSNGSERLCSNVSGACVKDFVTVGRIRALQVQGHWREVLVETRRSVGRMHVRVKAPMRSDVVRGRKFRYEIEETIVIAEFGRAGGTMREVRERATEVDMVLPERELRVPQGWSVCCDGLLRLNVQTTVVAFGEGVDVSLEESEMGTKGSPVAKMMTLRLPCDNSEICN